MQRLAGYARQVSRLMQSTQSPGCTSGCHVGCRQASNLYLPCFEPDLRVTLMTQAGQLLLACILQHSFRTLLEGEGALSSTLSGCCHKHVAAIINTFEERPCSMYWGCQLQGARNCSGVHPDVCRE